MILVAKCENEIERLDLTADRCHGYLRFGPGMQQAACTTCGAWCGISVAKWIRVEPEIADTTYTEGDPVYVALPEYEGTGVVITATPEDGLIIQVRAWDPTRKQRRTVLVPEHLIDYAVRPYRRPACQYCGSIRVVIDGLPGGRTRWTCCDCAGGQDT